MATDRDQQLADIQRCIVKMFSNNKEDQRSGLDEVLQYGEIAFEPLVAALNGGDGPKSGGKYGGWEYIGRALLAIDKPRAIEHLLPLLDPNADGDYRKGKDVVRLLAELGYPEAIEHQLADIHYCIRHMMRPDGGDQWSGLEKIVKYGAIAFEPLVTALHGDDKQGGGWEYIGRALLEIDKPRAVELLLEALHDDQYPGKQGDAARLLAELGETRAVEQLIKLADNDDATLHAAAVSALGQLPPDERAVEVLERRFVDGDGYTRSTSISLLTQIKKEQMVDRLLDIIATEKEKRVVERAVTSLGLTGDSRVYERLVQLAGDDADGIRLNAAIGLGYLGDQRAIPILISLLQDQEGLVASNAQKALYEIGGTQAIDPLIGFMQDTSNASYPRQAAAMRLLKTGDKRAVDAVLRYPDEQLRKRALADVNKDNWDYYFL